MNFDPNVAGSWVFAGVATIAAAFERYRSVMQSKNAEAAKHSVAEAHGKQGAHLEVVQAKEELIRLAREQAAAWQLKYEVEHKEAMDYRKDQHDRNEKINLKILSQSDEIAELRSKTDMTPIIRFHEAQDKINDKVVKSLDENAQINSKVLEALRSLLHGRDPAKESPTNP